ncbi:DUF6480 family protein [Streptomyces aidingensis]|uniref:Uncharacterized protein n=1 Tax=Streptomyces aidingensis TaxID=910347 RepID=A0A1I1R0X6_9ACTN|nr:DUF6480 family protein [Streptomyces aidingensis]SFD27965.1 hypothetical protein SAMN05421773_112122 [Streptomyces aidingensis]
MTHQAEPRHDRPGGGASPARPEPPPPGEGRGTSRPGETPPAEGSMSETGPYEAHNPTRGWGPVPLLLIVLLAASFVAFFIAYAIVIVAS